MALTDSEIESVIDKMKEIPGMRGVIEVDLRDNITEKKIFVPNGVKLYARPIAGDYIYTERFEETGDRYHQSRKYYRTMWLVERVGLPCDSNGDPEDIMAFVVRVKEDEVR